MNIKIIKSLSPYKIQIKKFLLKTLYSKILIEALLLDLAC